MDYQKVIIVGNIGSVETLFSKANKPYLRLSVASNMVHGEKKSVTWYTVLLYGRMAENIGALTEVLRVGRKVLCEGYPKNEAFIKKDGTAGIDNVIMLEKLPVFLDSAKSASGRNSDS